MKKETSLGKTLISAIQEAIQTPKTGKVVRPKIDIKLLRHRLHLTQKEFSKRYHLNLETLRNWEQGERSPDATGIAYLTCIAKSPEIINTLLNQNK